MNSIKVYNGEKHERGTWWYALFAGLIGLLIVFSLLYGNYSGVILLFFLVGGYFFYQVLHLQELQLLVQDDGIHIDKMFYAWGDLKGFVIELDKKSQLAHNLVLVTRTGHSIYTFADDLQQVEKVVMLIDERLPLLEVYNQTFAERMSRMLKL